MVTIVRIVKTGVKSFWRNGWLSTATIGVMTLVILTIANTNAAPAPAVLSANTMGSDTVKLSWPISTEPDFHRYELIRIEVFPPTATTVKIIYDRNQTTFDDINLTPERGYRYQLKTFNTAGEFSESNIAFAYTHFGTVVPFVFRPITIDGDFSDWEGIKEVFTDAAGDSLGTLPGTDFTKFYLARDNEYLYFRIDFANGLPPEGANILYHIGLDMPPRDGRPTPRDGSITFWNPQSRNQVMVYKILENESYYDLAALGGSSIETRARLDFIGNPDNFFTGVSINENNQWVDWQDIPNTLFEASFFLKVPRFYQNDKYFEYNPNWPSEPLGYLTNTTISQAGCALTSLTILANFWKANTTPDANEPTNPYTLNRWLKDNNGYDPNSGNLRWGKINSFSSKMHFVIDQTTISCTATNMALCRNILNQDLAANRPVIIDVSGHFVVAKNQTDNTWYINDPVNKTVSFLSRYNNRIEGLRRFAPGPADSLSFLNISLSSPAELLITDSQGRKTGFDPISQTSYNEIPKSLYYSERVDNDETGEIGPTIKNLYIGAPQNTTCTLQVIGTDLGLYKLSFDASDINGNSTVQSVSGLTQTGLITNYIIDYTSAPGEPTEIERTATIQSVIEEVKISYELGLITKESVKKILIAKLEAAQKLQEQKEKQLKHFDNLIEKAENPKVKEALLKARGKYEDGINRAITAILNEFIKEVEFYTKKGSITEKISKLLIDDARYIIERL